MRSRSLVGTFLNRALRENMSALPEYQVFKASSSTNTTEDTSLDESQAISSSGPTIGIREGYIGGSLHRLSCGKMSFA